MDELLTEGELVAGQLELSQDDARLYAEYRRLAAEQAALRRLSALVARGAEPSEVFDAVVNEMRGCLVAEGPGCGATRRATKSRFWPRLTVPHRR